MIMKNTSWIYLAENWNLCIFILWKRLCKQKILFVFQILLILCIDFISYHFFHLFTKLFQPLYTTAFLRYQSHLLNFWKCQMELLIWSILIYCFHSFICHIQCSELYLLNVPARNLINSFRTCNYHFFIMSICLFALLEF